LSAEVVKLLNDQAALELGRRRGRLPASVLRDVDRAGHRALVATARVHAAAYVAHVGMSQVAAVTAEEGHLIEQCPLAERRLRVLGDTFTGVVTAVIADMAW
jgi:hypothetical protein